MRNYNLIMSSLMVCFQYPWQFTKKVTFKYSLKFPILFGFIMTMLVIWGMIVHLLFAWIIKYLRGNTLYQRDILLDIMEHYRLGNAYSAEKLIKDEELSTAIVAYEISTVFDIMGKC